MAIANHQTNERHKKAAKTLGVSLSAHQEDALRAFNVLRTRIEARYGGVVSDDLQRRMQGELTPLREALLLLFPDLEQKIEPPQKQRQPKPKVAPSLVQTDKPLTLNGNRKKRKRSPIELSLPSFIFRRTQIPLPSISLQKPKRRRARKMKRRVSWTRLLLWLALTFGSIAFVVSALFEYTAIINVFPAEEGSILNLAVFGVSASFLLVLSLEGMKVVSIIMTRRWEVKNMSVSKSIVHITHTFKFLLIFLSSSASLALVSYYLNEGFSEKHFIDWKNVRVPIIEQKYEQEAFRLKNTWENEKARLDSLMEYETLSNGGVGARYQYYLEAKQREETAHNHRTLELAANREQALSHEQLTWQFHSREGPPKVGVVAAVASTFHISYRVVGLGLGCLLSILLELCIFIAFNSVATELFPLTKNK